MYIPIGIIIIKKNTETKVAAMWILSQQSELQSMSKNAVPLTSSEHINISINIETAGIYNTIPNPIDSRSLLKNTISDLPKFAFIIIHEKIIIEHMPKDIYIYG